MASDISRTSDEQRYDGVVMQQGRVILDRDFNALRQTIDHRTDADARDFVGPSGTPDDGFKIGPAASASSPPLWVPPAAQSSPPGSSPWDFSISPGTMYVGGQRATFPSHVPQQGAVDYSYFDQPEWRSPSAPATPLTQEFIYLHLLEHTVGAIEDPELKDVALGGPDTTQRLQLLKRVKRLAVTSADCATARAQAVTAWQQRGLQFESQTMRLIPQATLAVTYAEPTTPTDACDPVAQGGYLGADNQLIRVQISDGGIAGGAPQLLWGYDNASFLYRASVSTSTNNVLVLGQSPVDAYHIPQQGQVIEVLRSAFIIDTEPNASDPQAPGTVRCIAEPHGFIATLSAPYAPDTRSLSLSQSLPAQYLSDPNPLFVRIWQSSITAFTADGSTSYPLQNSDGTQTGVQVVIGVQPTGGPVPIGAYWMFAVRPGTPQAVYPERFLVSAQPPDGPRQWVCPLATIDWTGQDAGSPPNSPVSAAPVFHDCRNPFCNLVELSRRKLTGCCAVTVRPEDLAANPAALQNAADQFLGAAAGMTICLTPGTFALSQPLQLNSGHNGLTIEACHGGVTIQAATTGATAFFQGLIVLAGTDGVTFKGITFIPPAVELLSALPKLGDAASTALLALLRNLKSPRLLIGVRLRDCTHLSLIGCQFQLTPVADVSYFGAGLFASGNCTGLKVRDGLFTGSARVAPAPAAQAQPAGPALADAQPAANAPSADAVDVAIYLPPPAPAMLAGLLMAPRIEPGTTFRGKREPGRIATPATLDAAELVGNSMSGLDVAILIEAAVGAVRFESNSVTDCVGGLWLAGVDPASYADATGFQATLKNNIPQGSGAADALALALYYPLPDLAAASSAPAVLSPELLVVNNRIDAVPGDGTASGPACLLYLSSASADQQNPPVNFDPTILVNSNQLRNYCATGLAVAEVDTITPVIQDSEQHLFYIDFDDDSRVVNFSVSGKTSASEVATGLLNAWNANQAAAALAFAGAGDTLTLTAKTPGYPMGLSANVTPTGQDQLTLTIRTQSVPGYGATLYVDAPANVLVNANLAHNLHPYQEQNDPTELIGVVLLRRPNSLYVSPAPTSIAVAGNILLGASNLTALRSELPPLSTASLTAVPELANLVTWKFLNHAQP